MAGSVFDGEGDDVKGIEKCPECLGELTYSYCDPCKNTERVKMSYVDLKYAIASAEALYEAIQDDHTDDAGNVYENAVIDNGYYSGGTFSFTANDLNELIVAAKDYYLDHVNHEQ